MKIRYYLVDNPITEDPDDCKAQVANYESVTEKEIIEHITRKGAAITTAEAMANYQEIMESFEYFLKQGYGINTEFINARPTITGVFKNSNDTFDSSRHKINFRVKLGKHYNNIDSNIKTEKVEPVKNAPFVEVFKDVNTDTQNESITPGGTGTIMGSRLKFDASDENQGIFLVEAGGTVTRVNKVIVMKQSQIVFVIPQSLTTGEYTLEVRVLFKGNKEIKKGVLEDRLVA